MNGLEDRDGWLRQDGDAPYVIAMPVPNITGSLHIGHALNLVIQDVVARYLRGAGRSVAFAPGVDHAGLSGQLAAERKLRTHGRSRQQLGRQRFSEFMHRWHDDHLKRLLAQMRRLGLSADWDHAVSSIDDRRQQLIQDAFVAMYDTQLLYRDWCLVNWCTNCETCIPDEEIRRRELTRTAYHIAVTGRDGQQHTLMTLHPPLLLAACAVRAPVGHPAAGVPAVRVPVIDRDLVVTVDRARDRALGAQLSLVVPAYNADDFENARRGGASVDNLYAEDGTISAPGTSHDGLTDKECHHRLLHDLEAAGALLMTEPYLHGEARHSLCGGMVVPRATPQWFLSLDALQDVASGLLEADATRFNHPHWEQRYRAVLEMVAGGGGDRAPWWEGACLAFVRGFSSSRDWMVSRQNWWGVPIPAWACSRCDAIRVEPTDRSPCCPSCGLLMTPSPDVLDVLFHSALWAYCVNPDRARSHHADLAVIGHDILEFWMPTANLLALPLFGHPSIRHVVVHGVICDKDGEKMSKSLGNTIDLDDLLATHGTEAVRSLVLGLLERADGMESIPMRTQDLDEAVLIVKLLNTWIRSVVPCEEASETLADELHSIQRSISESMDRLDVAEAYQSVARLARVLQAHQAASSGELRVIAEILQPFHPGVGERFKAHSRAWSSRSRQVRAAAGGGPAT